MIKSMRKESGKITSDIEEILKICPDFCKSLYIQTMRTPESTMKSSPDTEEIPEFTEEEAEKAIKRTKDTKPMEWMELKVILQKWVDKSSSPTYQTSSKTY